MKAFVGERAFGGWRVGIGGWLWLGSCENWDRSLWVPSRMPAIENYSIYGGRGANIVSKSIQVMAYWPEGTITRTFSGLVEG